MKIASFVSCLVLTSSNGLTGEIAESQKKWIEVYEKQPNVPKPGDMLVAGRNLGCGSSRDHAVKALKAAGARAVMLAGRPGRDERWNEAALRAAERDGARARHRARY